MVIYKYLDEDGAVKTIEKDAVLLREPTYFNDPFDSVFYVKDSELKKSSDLFLNYEMFKRVYKELIVDKKKPSCFGKEIIPSLKEHSKEIQKLEKYTALDRFELTYELALRYLGMSKVQFENQFNKTMKKIVESLKSLALVSCFGSTNDSILMWSHYSNKHKGVCFEYEIDDSDFKNVEYYDHMKSFKFYDALSIILASDFIGKTVDTNDENNKFVIEPILVKSSVWAYEGEIRCVYSKTNLDSKIFIDKSDSEEKYLLKMPKIKNIFIGCNATKEFISKIKQIASDIPIFKMQMKKGEFALIQKRL